MGVYVHVHWILDTLCERTYGTACIHVHVCTCTCDLEGVKSRDFPHLQAEFPLLDYLEAHIQELTVLNYGKPLLACVPLPPSGKLKLAIFTCMYMYRTIIITNITSVLVLSLKQLS